MAQKVANKKDPRQCLCENEAKNIVIDWFKKQNLASNKNSLRIVWFAYTTTGFKCMITSETYTNNFFEVTINKITGEMYCNCFERFEYFVTPSTEPENVVIDDTNDSLI